MYTNFAYSIIACNKYTHTGCSGLFFPRLPRNENPKIEYINANCAKRTERAYVCARLNKKKAHAFGKVRHFIRLFLILFFFLSPFFSVFVCLSCTSFVATCRKRTTFAICKQFEQSESVREEK